MLFLCQNFFVFRKYEGSFHVLTPLFIFSSIFAPETLLIVPFVLQPSFLATTLLLLFLLLLFIFYILIRGLIQPEGSPVGGIFLPLDVAIQRN